MKKENKNVMITLLKITLVGVSIFGFMWGVFFSTFNGFVIIILEIFGQTEHSKHFNTTIPILVAWASFLLGVSTVLSVFFPRNLKTIIALALLIFSAKLFYVWLDPGQRALEAKIAQEKIDEQNYYQNILPWLNKLKTYQFRIEEAVHSQNPEKIKLAQKQCQEFLLTQPTKTLNYSNEAQISKSCSLAPKN